MLQNLKNSLILSLTLSLACGGGTSTPNPPPPPPPAPVGSVTLSPGSATLVPQQTAALSATLRDASGNVLSGRAVSWSSSAPGVAGVDGGGLVTAATAGGATITASSEGKSGSAAITVNEGGFVGAGGGQANTGNGNASVTVPAGALAAGTALTITPLANPPPDPHLIPGSAYDLGPNGTQFAQAVTLRIRYDAAQVPVGANPAQFRLARLVGATWTPIPGSTVDVGTHMVTGQTSSFSSYAIVEVLPPVTSVIITGSLRVKVGDSYSYTATARLADGTVVVRPITWSILETAKGTMTAGGTLTPLQTGSITLLATIDGVVWQSFTTAYDWTTLSGSGSLFLTLLADNQITNKFGTSEYAELVLACSNTGSFLVWVSTTSFVTASGLVSYSFDGGSIVSQTWLEFDSFHSLGYPGLTNLAQKTYGQVLAASRSFGFAFTEFQGSAKAMIFRVTGLGGILPPLLAACPSNSIMAGETELRSLLQRLPSRSAPNPQVAADVARRAELGPQLVGTPSLMLLRAPETQKGVRRPR